MGLVQNASTFSTLIRKEKDQHHSHILQALRMVHQGDMVINESSNIL
jgi:hypothetical protein